MKNGITIKEPAPIYALGKLIDLDNMPILYRKAVENPDELEKQLESVANAWHDGDIRAAMIALESDLAHG